jgi:NADPH2:quinone reductase
LDAVVVEHHAPLEPGPGQVTVTVRAAGVNFVDGLICQGRYQLRPSAPFVPGGEIAGVVDAAGEGVSAWSVGDRVLAFTGLGAFAEQVVLPAGSVRSLPGELTFAQGAAMAQSYCTAMIALARRCALSPGEWVLVLGAGGGIGLAATDVAVALGGRVIAAASSADRLEAARAMGAEAVVAYEVEDLKARARDLSGGGVDVAIDPVGGRHSEPALRALGDFGRLCVIGFASGTIASLPLNQVLLRNRAIIGVDWGSWALRNADANAELLDEVLAMAAAGCLHPPVPAERPLDEAAPAMAGLLDRSISGKVVLVP